MSLDERLELDVTEALRGIDSIEDALSGAATSFKVALAEALDVLGTVTVGDVDASSVTSAIDSAVASADTSPVIDADAGEITGEIDAAVAAADTAVAIEASADDVTSEIDAAVAAADSEVIIDVEADTSAAEDAIEDLGDTATESAGGVGDLSGVTSGLGAAAGAATGDVAALAGGAGALGPEAAAAGGAVLALGGAVNEFFGAAVASESAQRRLTTAAGEFADEVENIDIGGFNESLGELAERTGQDDEALRLAAARFFDLGKNAGVAGPQVAESVKQLEAISITLATANPALGQAGDVADRLTTGFARGGRALAPFGIALSSTEINARALGDTGKEVAGDLTIFEKAQAGLNIALERSPDLAAKVAEGLKNPQIQVQALREEFANAIETIGQPLVAPVLELLEGALPVGVELAEVLARFGTIVLPGVTASLESLVAPLEVVNTLLGALSDASAEVDELVPGLDLGGKIADLANPLSLVNNVVETGTDLWAELTGNTKENEEAVAAQEAAIRSLTAALGDAESGIEDTTGAFTEAQAVSGDLDDEIAKVGVTYDQIAKAAAGGKPSTDAFIADLKRARSEGKITGEEFDRLKTFISDLGSVFQDSAQNALDHAVATGEFTRAQVDNAISTNTAKDGTVNYVAVLGQLRGATDSATAGTEAHTAALDALGRSIEEVLAAEEAQIQKELSLASAALGAESAARNVEKAQRDLAAAIAEGGAESDKAVEAEFRLRQAQQSQTEALVRLAAQQRDTTVAQLENSGITVDAGAKSAIYRENLLALAATVEEPMRTQIVGLANDITAIPDASNTDINADAAKAWDTISETERQIDVLTQDRIIQIAVEVFGAANAQAIIDGIAHDAGNITVGVTPRMAGGPLDTGDVGFVGEVEPEIIVARRPSVVGNQAQLQAAIAGEVAAALNRFGDRVVAGGGSSVGPIIVNEVANDPVATANAVAFRLGEDSQR